MLIRPAQQKTYGNRIISYHWIEYLKHAIEKIKNKSNNLTTDLVSLKMSFSSQLPLSSKPFSLFISLNIQLTFCTCHSVIYLVYPCILHACPLSSIINYILWIFSFIATHFLLRHILLWLPSQINEPIYRLVK